MAKNIKDKITLPILKDFCPIIQPNQPNQPSRSVDMLGSFPSNLSGSSTNRRSTPISRSPICYSMCFCYFYTGIQGIVKGDIDVCHRYIKDSLVKQYGPCIVHNTVFCHNVKTVSFNIFGLCQESHEPNLNVVIYKSKMGIKCRWKIEISTTDSYIYSRPSLNTFQLNFHVSRPKLYEKQVREIPRKWMKDLNPYVNKHWREEKIRIENNKKNLKNLINIKIAGNMIKPRASKTDNESCELVSTMEID